VACVVVLVLCASSASAQRPRPDRPYRGLFGGNGADPNSSQTLDLNVSLFGAYDDNVLASNGQGSINPEYMQSGGFGTGTMSLDYTKKAGRATLDFSGGTAYRYYPSLHELNGASYFASVGVSTKLGRRTTLSVTGSGSYTPFFWYDQSLLSAQGTSGTVTVIDPQQALVNQAATTAYSSASLDHQFTARSSLSLDGSFNYTDYQARSKPFKSASGGGMYRYRITSRIGIHAGYHYRHGTLGYYSTTDEPVDIHDLDVGVDYNRPLSRTKKLTFGFSTGSSIYKVTESPALTGVVSDGTSADLYRRTRYAVNASAFLNQQIGRSWTARLDYRRGLQLVQGFAAPFFADSVNASLQGFLGTRSRLQFSGAYSNGDVGISIDSRRYSTASATANYQFAVGRWAALFVEYDYYHYRFDEGVVLPVGMGRSLGRNGARGGLNLWLPLLR
jgi:hypothetical protein